jgi:hypothetical protein
MTLTASRPGVQEVSGAPTEMTKRRPFDPTVLEQNRPSQSIKPIDFMKPMEETVLEAVPPPAREVKRSTRVAPVVLPDDPRTQPVPQMTAIPSRALSSSFIGRINFATRSY